MQAATEQNVWDWLADVPDPEIPVVSVVDLGMVRAVRVGSSGVEVDVAPTYSGCPATEVIEQHIRRCLEARVDGDVTVRRVLSPPWTTDWISDAGRARLRAHGIAPPAGPASRRELVGRPPIACPRCGSTRTAAVSEFGSTACKAAYRCEACLEPFEYFKCI